MMFELFMHLSSLEQFDQNSLIKVWSCYKFHLISDTLETHCDTYILIVNFWLHNHWVCCNGMHAMVRHHWRIKHCLSVWVWMSAILHNGALSQVCNLQILSPMNTFYVHTILHQIPFRSNTISSKFHTCNGKGCMSFKSGGTSCRLPGRFSSKG